MGMNNFRILLSLHRIMRKRRLSIGKAYEEMARETGMDVQDISNVYCAALNARLKHPCYRQRLMRRALRSRDKWRNVA